jgi:serine/threonine protein kinase
LKCPSCQASVSDDSHFCSKCGASLKGEGQTRTIQNPALMFKKGQVIAGKYRIIKKIGEGGMGVVYKAQDTKLDRPVALKFLPSELTRDQASKKRFIQEAKAAAALNHPNITIVHEIGEDEGRTFIAMEFIEGQTLRDKIESGPLEIEEAVNIAFQVSEGLSTGTSSRPTSC